VPAHEAEVTRPARTDPKRHRAVADREPVVEDEERAIQRAQSLSGLARDLLSPIDMRGDESQLRSGHRVRQLIVEDVDRRGRVGKRAPRHRHRRRRGEDQR